MSGQSGIFCYAKRLDFAQVSSVTVEDIARLVHERKMQELAKGLDPSEYDTVATSDAKKQHQRRAGRLLQKLESQKKK
ncbi:MAG: hypothetical protein GX776_07320 [Oxalobacter sp.]|nr:hypothetical protein [Oxalobacter sp.]